MAETLKLNHGASVETNRNIDFELATARRMFPTNEKLLDAAKTHFAALEKALLRQQAGQQSAGVIVYTHAMKATVCLIRIMEEGTKEYETQNNTTEETARPENK